LTGVVCTFTIGRLGAPPVFFFRGIAPSFNGRTAALEQHISHPVDQVGPPRPKCNFGHEQTLHFTVKTFRFRTEFRRATKHLGSSAYEGNPRLPGRLASLR
jgi:hypothetical protein